MAMKTILAPIPDTAVNAAAIETALMVARAVAGHVEALFIESPRDIECVGIDLEDRVHVRPTPIDPLDRVEVDLDDRVRGQPPVLHPLHELGEGDLVELGDD